MRTQRTRTTIVCVAMLGFDAIEPLARPICLPLRSVCPVLLPPLQTPSLERRRRQAVSTGSRVVGIFPPRRRDDCCQPGEIALLAPAPHAGRTS
jgi:hypothetical protein